MDRPYRIFISTGEVSGDLQGSLLIPALIAEAQSRGYSLEIWALGGPRMAAVGARLLGDTSQIGAIGPVNALPFVWPTLKLHKQVMDQFKQVPPDLTVLIDYIGPNLRLGQRLKQAFPSPVVYYIAPPEWVWSQGLGVTRQVVDLSDKMLAIFPQEATYYQGMGADINWVGHPLVDHVHQFPPREQARQQLGLHPQQPMMALMPASRQQELDHLLPIILTAARRIYHQVPNLQFWMPLALSAYRRDVTQAIQKTGLPISISPDSQTVIAAADVVITKSGTANLEAALLNVPQVVVYRVGAISAWLYQHLLHFEVEFISPVNLVVGREIVPELLQQEVTPEKIAELACSLLEKGEARHTMMAEYQELRSHLGLPGVLQRAAEAILNALEQSLR
ncbi:lipid-A-disaccharide synthase [Acaryochloris sp. CCMEE 5410]|uniref:lipid-A-disaccharide synthase n=1 Tax=Acaryochloris sp. CCMEE 5410 TaxID=310037 RepID=UPI000248479A|nr:lipid-A-disaccharide synthase [Acaryochloris sp. CCMEE 5410]KAI9130637.1 lipid-A-disaccharide synthase [Acaryochloris sp. CCMEE 5410]